MVLDGLTGAVEQTAEYLYQRASCVIAIGGNPHESWRCWSGRSKPIAITPAPVLPGIENDRRGNDEAALDFTSGRPISFPPMSVRC